MPVPVSIPFLDGRFADCLACLRGAANGISAPLGTDLRPENQDGLDGETDFRIFGHHCSDR